MCRLVPLSILAMTLCVAPLVHAMSAPLSEDELTAAASLIVTGHISEVVCQGEPVVDGESTTSLYHATLTIEAVTKPADSTKTSVTLPFAVVVWENEPPMGSCGWAPSYQVGERGLYYLSTGAATELYTLVHWNAFVPDEDSAGEALPSCEAPEPEPDATISEDISESTEDASEVGPMDDAAHDFPSEPICTDDSDCPSGQECVWIDSVTSDCVNVGGGDSDAGPSDPPAADADEAIDESLQCVNDSECGGCGSCAQGTCNYAPHCPDCLSDSDCAEGQECHWIYNETDAYCRDIDSGGGTSGGDDSGGCTGGGSQAPLTLALLVLGLTALSGRRRMARGVRG